MSKQYPSFVIEKKQDLTVLRDPRISLESILFALDQNGEIIKESNKWHTRQIGGWFVKTSQKAGVWGIIRWSFSRKSRYTMWKIPQILARQGVTCPRILAIIDRTKLGLIQQRTIISEYMPGMRDVENFAKHIMTTEKAATQLQTFFHGLAAALRALMNSDVYHSDLSGKNILTSDGNTFIFVDLEAAHISRYYFARRRLKNLVQIYDSFCDFVPDDYLRPFLTSLVPNVCGNPEEWFARIQLLQNQRRMAHLRKINW